MRENKQIIKSENELRELVLRKIDAIMREHGWKNVNQMAANCDFSYNTLKGIFIGSKSVVPKLETIRRICEKVDMPLDAFFKVEEDLPPEKDLSDYTEITITGKREFIRLIDKLQNLPEEKREIILKMIDMVDSGV